MKTSTKKTKSTKTASKAKGAVRAPAKAGPAVVKGKANDGLKTRPTLAPPAAVGAAAKGNGLPRSPLTADFVLSADARTVPGVVPFIPENRKGPVNATATGRPELIDWKDLEPGFNARGTFEENKLRELAASIAAVGLKQRLIVYPHPTKKGKYAIHGGNRRYLAIEILIEEKKWAGGVPCEVQCDAPASGRDLTGMIENIIRVDLDPIEKAKGLKRLVDSGSFLAWTEDKAQEHRSLGHILGHKSKSQIYGLLSLADLGPLAAQAAAAWPDGEDAISPSVAQRLARIKDPKLQAAAAKRAIQEHWTDARAKDEIQRLQKQLKDAPFDTKAPDLVPRNEAEGWGGSCLTCLYRSGNQREMFGEFDGKEGRQDMCLRPSCFEAKCEMGWQRRAKAHEAAGGRVLNKGEAEKAGFHAWSSSPNNQYVDISKAVQFIDYNGPKTDEPVSKLLAKGIGLGEIKTTLARTNDGSNRVVEMLPRKQAEELIRKQYPLIEKAVKKYEAEGTRRGNEALTAESHEVRRAHQSRALEQARKLYAGKLAGTPALGLMRALCAYFVYFDGCTEKDLEIAGVKSLEEEQDQTDSETLTKALPAMEPARVEALFLNVLENTWHENAVMAEWLLGALGKDGPAEIAKIEKQLPSLEAIAAEMNAERDKQRKIRELLPQARKIKAEVAAAKTGWSYHTLREKLGISMELATAIGDRMVDDPDGKKDGADTEDDE